MLRGIAATVLCGMAVIGVMISADWVGAQDPAAPAEVTGPTPAMDTARLMKVFTDPMFETLKEKMKVAPAVPKDWRIIEDHGLAASELANLMFMRTGEHEQTPEWKQFTVEFYKAGNALAEAAKTRDFAVVSQKYQELAKSCNACHQKFEPDTTPEIIP
jgi:hypothetical protein